MRPRKSSCPFRFPCCALRTASAMVRLLPRSTTVLTVPRVRSRWRLPSANAWAWPRMYTKNPAKRPPKNMISVRRKAHMPRVEASYCCVASSNWWATCEACSATVPLRRGVVGVRLLGDDRRPVEVERRRRRRRLPLQPGGAPRIVAGRLSLEQGPDEVEEPGSGSRGRGWCRPRSRARSTSGTPAGRHGSDAACPGSRGRIAGGRSG